MLHYLGQLIAALRRIPAGRTGRIIFPIINKRGDIAVRVGDLRQIAMNEKLCIIFIILHRVIGTRLRDRQS